MDLSSVGSSEEIQRMQQLQGNSNSTGTPPGPPPEGFPGQDDATISKIGKLFGSLSSEGQAEMKNFHQDMMDSVMNGSFDAEEMAENAPEELKELANEQGVDLASLLGETASKISEMKNNFGGRPPEMGGKQGGPPPNEASVSSQDEEDESGTSALIEDENENGIPDNLEPDQGLS